MKRYDCLPRDLRLWLASAALPWSPASALRLWARLGPECNDDAGIMRHRMDRIEARMLARDAAKIWGPAYPRAVPEAQGGSA